MIDILIAMFKFVGMFLTGVFGIFGLLVSFKGADGKITKYGKTALWLIALSTIIAIGAHSLELFLKREEKISTTEQRAKDGLAAVKRAEIVLSEIKRGLQPIRNVFIGYWISVPMDHARLKSYVTRVDNEVDTIISLLDSGQKAPGIVGTSMDAEGNYISFEYNLKSPLAPDKKNKQPAYKILGHAEIELQFFRTPIDPQQHSRISGKLLHKPDLKLRVGSELDTGELPDKHSVEYAIKSKDSRELPGNHSVEYDIKSKHFKLSGHMIPSDPQSWKSSGKIVNIHDLLGSQMFILLPSSVRSEKNPEEKYITEIRRRFELDILIIRMSSGHGYWLTTEALEKHSTKDGANIYVYTFPDNMEELTKLTR